MSGLETVTLGRAKRATAGNRMRELLEKAHQQDDDELFLEEEGDEEFTAPLDQRDVFLDEFADTDDEVEIDEEEAERQMRREERRKAKGKSKAIYNPMGPVKVKKVQFPADPSSSTPSSPANVSLLDPSIDPNTMAPSTLVLALRKQRREQKRLNRSQTVRSSLRASTLRTEEDILAKEKNEKLNPNRKGRRAQHETGEIRIVRKMTQAELIAEALEEEERNKEALRDWVRREEEKRELRRVGRKRVRGPRWTWISRTVGKLVEEVEETAKTPTARQSSTEPLTARESSFPAKNTSLPDPESKPDTPIATKESAPGTPISEAPAVINPELVSSQAGVDPPAEIDIEELPKPVDQAAVTRAPTTLPPTSTETLDAQSETSTPIPPTPAAGPSRDESAVPEPVNALAGPSSRPSEPPTLSVPTSDKDGLSPAPIPPEPSTAENNAQYTRNYIILSQIPGGLAAELKLILGDHVEWDQVQYIPHRNRPINRRPTICPFTGLSAKYRHPVTMTPYASIEGYKQIEALLKHRYVWNEEVSAWFGGEEDVSAEGADEVDGWAEAIHGGWMGGKEIIIEEVPPEAEPEEAVEEAEAEAAIEDVAAPKKGKRKVGEVDEGDGRPPAGKKSKVIKPKGKPGPKPKPKKTKS